jgi:hypothetical protein
VGVEPVDAELEALERAAVDLVDRRALQDDVAGPCQTNVAGLKLTLRRLPQAAPSCRHSERAGCCRDGSAAETNAADRWRTRSVADRERT